MEKKLQFVWAKTHLSGCKKSPQSVQDLYGGKTIFQHTPLLHSASSVSYHHSSTTSKSSQQQSIATFIVKLTKDKKAQIDVKWAEFNKVFHDYSKSLNPAYTPPTRKTISTTLFDKFYNNRFNKLQEFLQPAANLTLVTDRWSNICQDHIVNFVFVKQNPSSTTECYFYKSIYTNRICQISQQIYSDIKSIIEEVGPNKFCAVVTDNCSSMQGAWDLIETNYPFIFANGCAAHVINLLIKDIFQIRDHIETLEKAKDIIKFIRNHQIVLTKFKQIQQGMKSSNILTKIKALDLPVETHWYSKHNTIKSLLINKTCVQSLFSDRNFNTEVRDNGATGIRVNYQQTDCVYS